jgi:3-dehydrosphinganine reductase
MPSKPFSIDSHTIAVVTGGSSGIGLAVARQLTQKGCHVWMAARRMELLNQALRDLETLRVSPEQRFGFTAADLSDARQAEETVRQVVEVIGPPNLLVNSAGIVEPGCFIDLTLEDFHRQMEVNFYASLYMVKAVIPAMLERGSGCIVNVASMASVIGLFGYSAYSASKFAVRGFSESLRSELKPQGIHVMLVYPPDTDTPQLAYDRQRKPPETAVISATAKVMSAEAVAGDILKGIQRRRMTVIPGFDTRLLNWLVRFMGDGIFPVIDFLIGYVKPKPY